MKFIVFESNWEVTRKLFKDFEFCNEVILFKRIQPTLFLERLFESHIKGRLSFLPMKNIWNILSAINKIPNTEQYIFLFIGGPNTTFAVESRLIDYLRKRFDSCYFVGYYLDIHYARLQNIKYAKQKFDKLYIFDEIESKKMGIDYYPIPFSKGISSDIAYVGQDKGRLKELVKIYDYLEPFGINCAFYIIGVPENKRIDRNGIVYGEPVDYETSLQYILNTNCVLELSVDGIESYSDRVQKAIAYNKKILTNNANIKKNPFFNSNMIKIYSSICEIDPYFVKETIDKISYNYNNEFSPIYFLKRIQNDLCKKRK